MTEWERVDEVYLTDRTNIMHALVEANGDARRLMGRKSRADDDLSIVACWRVGTPASVRVLDDATPVPGRRAIIEQQLISYVAGIDPLDLPTDCIIIDTREPHHRDEDQL